MHGGVRREYPLSARPNGWLCRGELWSPYKVLLHNSDVADCTGTIGKAVRLEAQPLQQRDE
jgi:hypothetical protein